jgi:hypothetical protein
MEINKNNYEAFFLDYFEGNLNDLQTQHLFQFLENNPELKNEFKSFENISIEKEEIVFEEKNDLIKPEVNHHNYQSFLIASAERDLNRTEERALESFLKSHPEYNTDKVLYAALKAVPDEGVSFIDKEALKRAERKPAGKVIYLYRSIAVAASVILAAFIFIQVNKPGNLQTADNSNTKETIKEQPVVQNKDEDETMPVKIEEEKANTNLADIPEVKKQKKNVEATEKIKDVKTIEPQIVYTAPQKIAPVLKIDNTSDFQEAPELATIENPATPVITNENQSTTPTLAQAAIKVVENVISGEIIPGNEAGAATSVVDLAASGINKITGKETVSFEKNYNDEGQIQKFRISAGNFTISRNKSR